MSPLWTHGNPAYLLGRMIDVMVDELDIPYEPADPVTFRRRDLEKGAEPDKCFYFGENAARVCGKRDIILPDDPSPDLVVEVDVTASSVERLPIFAALGVPEVWRLSDRGLEFLHLQPDSTYHAGDLWGCIGFWYSGGWYDADANNYISLVQYWYATTPWVQPGF